MKFAASSSDVTLRSIDLEKVGLGNRAGLYRVFLERDGMRVSGKASFQTDGKATISLSPSLIIKAGSNETLDFVVMLSGVENGNEYAFKFTAVDSTAQTVNMNITTNSIRTANYSVAATTIDVKGNDTTIKGNEAINVELAKFTILNANSDEKTTNFKAITLRQEGNADLANLANLAIYKDATKVSSSYAINGKNITFAVNADILANQTNTFYVKADVTTVENPGPTRDTYAFYLRNTEDLNVVEKTTSFRTNVANAFTSTDNIVYTVEGGDVTFTRDTTLSAQTVAPGSTDVLLMKGTITTKEPITLENAALSLKIANPTQVVNKFTLKIGSSTSTRTPGSADTGTRLTGAFDGSWTINSSAAVYLYADIKSTATGGTIALMQAINLDTFTTKTYVSSQNAVGAGIGSIAGVTLTVKTPSLYLTRTDGLSSRSIVK